jgi:hypothetical protein
MQPRIGVSVMRDRLSHQAYAPPMNLVKRIWFATGGVISGILVVEVFATKFGHGAPYWYVFAFLLLGSTVGALKAAFR